MSDENVAVEKIHIQTLINNDPDFLEDEPVPKLQDLIEYHITFQSKNFNDFCKHAELQGHIKNILYDSEDDKLGRIKDLYDAEIKRIAEYIADNHQNNNFARWAYEETMKYII